MRTILHITAHLGGGVGRVLTSLIDQLITADNRYEHRIASFEYINEPCLRWAVSRGVAYRQEVSPAAPEFHQQVREADLVHLHFWNHPAIYHFLRTFSGQKARLVLWSHVNGHYPPYKFNPAILRFPEMFTVSTAYSLETPEVKALPEQYRRDHVRFVFTTAGAGIYRYVRPVPHDGFNVGYVGTVDYAKMHPDFLDICAQVKVPKVRFIVCGGKRHLEIGWQAAEKVLGHIFDFRGQIDDVFQALAEFDVFGYPLTPHHYGTGEQTLIEAMAAGVPQVVLDNGPEGYVVQDGVTGIVARNLPDYVKAIETLYADQTLRQRLSDGSREYAVRAYSIETAAQRWLEVYDELLARDKRPCVFENGRLPNPEDRGMPLKLFLAALGECEASRAFRAALNWYPGEPDGLTRTRIQALDPIFKSLTRGSAAHYSGWFTTSDELRYLRELTTGPIH